MDEVEEIKQKIDVVGLISSYLTLKKAGRNYKALCPFHKEKTPSFMVSPEKQIWYCFGCNQGGDIFSFVQKLEGLDFVGVLNMLADKAGVVLERGGGVRKAEKDKYLEINETASKFFSYVLNKTKVGEEAKKYLLRDRKLKEETIKYFSLGYAPNSPASLKDFLLKKEYTEGDLLKIGLLSRNYQGKIVDKFRGRIIFPIKNTTGKMVGFAGRILKEKKEGNFIPPKYLNSPQSLIYDKSAVLYGLYEAKDSIREKDLAIITEGYMDVISSHEIDVRNVVASSGTALTETQIKILSRYTPNIAFSFDQDTAGQLATKRAMEMTRYEDINVGAIVIKNAKDPDELIKKNPQEWKEVSKNPVPIVEFYYNSILSRYEGKRGVEDKKKIASELIPVIANIADSVEKAHWIKKISEDLEVNEKYIMDAVGKVKVFLPQEEVEQEMAEEEKEIKISPEMLLLGAVILYPASLGDFFAKIKEEYLLEEEAKNLYKVIFNLYNKKDASKIKSEELSKNLSKDAKEKLDLLFFLTQNFFEGMNEEEIFADIAKLTEKVLFKKKEEEKKSIEEEIRQADKVKDREKIKELLRKLQGLI